MFYYFWCMRAVRCTKVQVEKGCGLICSQLIVKCGSSASSFPSEFREIFTRKRSRWFIDSMIYFPLAPIGLPLVLSLQFAGDVIGTGEARREDLTCSADPYVLLRWRLTSLVRGTWITGFSLCSVWSLKPTCYSTPFKFLLQFKLIRIYFCFRLCMRYFLFIL